MSDLTEKQEVSVIRRLDDIDDIQSEIRGRSTDVLNVMSRLEVNSEDQSIRVFNSDFKRFLPELIADLNQLASLGAELAACATTVRAHLESIEEDKFPGLTKKKFQN